MPEPGEFAGARALPLARDGIGGADVVMMLRIQNERLATPTRPTPSLLPRVGPQRREPAPRAARRHRHAPGTDEPRRGDHERRRRRPAVGDPPAGDATASRCAWRCSDDRAQRAGAQRRGGPEGRMNGREHRGTIFVEDAELLAQQDFPGRQFVIRLRAPKCAARRHARQLRAPDLRSADPDAPAAVDHARRPGGGLDRDALQDPRARASRHCRRSPSGSRDRVHGPDRPGLHAVARAAAHAAGRRRRRHPADGVPRRVAPGARATPSGSRWC